MSDQPKPPLNDDRLRELAFDWMVCTNANERAMAAELLELRHLLGVIECIKKTGGAVEIRGVRIEPCDEYGETATIRNVAEGGRIAERLDSELLAARDRISVLVWQLREEGNRAGRLEDQLRTACTAGADARERAIELERDRDAGRLTLDRVADELGCTRDQLDLWFARNVMTEIRITRDRVHELGTQMDRVTDLFEKWAAEENEHRTAGEFGLAEGLHVAIEELRVAVHGKEATDV